LLVGSCASQFVAVFSKLEKMLEIGGMSSL